MVEDNKDQTEDDVSEAKIREIVQEEMADEGESSNRASGRRNFLKATALTGLGGLSLGVGGQEIVKNGIGISRATTSGGSLSNIGTLEGPLTGGDSLTNIAGSNLSIDSSGNLNATSPTDIGVVTYLSTAQTLSSGTTSKIQYDTTAFDHRSEFDASNHEIQLSGAGTYMATFTVKFNSPPDQTLISNRISLNGTRIGSETRGSSGGYDETLTSHALFEASKGDVVSVAAFQDSGSSLELKSGRWNTNLSVVQLG
ncbi:hypothetical protein [Halorussus lipolyticus]|uniref:hypothetical protein n=1 Tax=Halorussus lipolyticus TaxID=3034024 RepID=UPI0023E8855F|nr:hypothetical protein [Halorussus sp. DT80]